MVNICVFASHNGSDMQAIIDGCNDGTIKGRVALVISNNIDAYALERARLNGIDCYCISQIDYPDEYDRDSRMLNLINEYNIDIIFLAGYLKKLGDNIIAEYSDRIYNIHPALLPKYGGKGMYGIRVHQAVIDSGDIVTGVTIHKVNGEYDRGDIIESATVPVVDGDTAETLAARVLKREHTFIVEALAKIVDGYDNKNV